PDSSVTTWRSARVSRFLIRRATPGTLPPEESVTAPSIEDSPCANTGAARTTARRSVAVAIKRNLAHFNLWNVRGCIALSPKINSSSEASAKRSEEDCREKTKNPPAGAAVGQPKLRL